MKTPRFVTITNSHKCLALKALIVYNGIGNTDTFGPALSGQGFEQDIA